jgi:hypothetical protein
MVVMRYPILLTAYIVNTHSDQNYPATLVFQNYANHHMLI